MVKVLMSVWQYRQPRGGSGQPSGAFFHFGSIQDMGVWDDSRFFGGQAWSWLFITGSEQEEEYSSPEVASSLTEKVHSCDQERQSALEEARQNPREGIVIPECAPGGLYKPVQCHQSTGYCWCVLVDTGRPLPGTSTR